MKIKIHKGTRYVVAVCDEEVFGKKYEDTDGIREIDLTGKFFDGETKTEEEIEEILIDMRMEDSSFNIVGEKSCEIALRAGIIKKEGITKISEIPIALVLL